MERLMSLARPVRPGKALISAFVGMLALPLLASCAYDDGYYDPAPVYGGGYGYGGYGYNHGYYGDPCWPYGCDDWRHRHHHHGSGDDDDGDNSHHHHHGGGDPPGGGPGGPGGPGPQTNNNPSPPYPYPPWNKQQRDSKN
ncbi:MAG TPA: hypothetical protein VE914_04375 [Candidatus Angelobacter sp.]|nr:hypothetical protein [Candidatus Angelobacter sp.]